MLARRVTKNLTDSGNLAINSGTLSSGNMPPSNSSACHPICGITHDAANPPSAAPKVKPQNTTVIMKERFFSGAYSEIKVPTFGIAAPSPNPVIKRKNII
ncbi:hypothetical protein D3C78_1378870 [compost metagenome]